MGAYHKCGRLPLSIGPYSRKHTRCCRNFKVVFYETASDPLAQTHPTVYNYASLSPLATVAEVLHPCCRSTYNRIVTTKGGDRIGPTTPSTGGAKMVWLFSADVG